jgi:hypothetical protein
MAYCRLCETVFPTPAQLEAYLEAYVADLPDQERADETVMARRLALCRTCPHLRIATCSLCGCYVQAAVPRFACAARLRRPGGSVGAAFPRPIARRRRQSCLVRMKIRGTATPPTASAVFSAVCRAQWGVFFYLGFPGIPGKQTAYAILRGSLYQRKSL